MVYEKNRQEANVLFMKNQLEVVGDDDPFQPLPLEMVIKYWTSKDSLFSVSKPLLDSEEMELPPFKRGDSIFSLSSTRAGFDEPSNDHPPGAGLPSALSPPFSRNPAAEDDLDIMDRFQSTETIDFDIDLFEQDFKEMDEVGFA